MIALDEAREVLDKIQAAGKASRAIRSAISAASMAEIRIGYEVLIYRQHSNQWIGSYKVLNLSGKMSHVDINVRTSHFAFDKVNFILEKLYRLQMETGIL